MNNHLLALAIGAAIAALLGSLVHKRSVKKESIHGGSVAAISHYVATSAISGVLPVVIVGLILGNGLPFTLPAALGFMFIGWVGLLTYAIIEHKARANINLEDQQWTEEDARASGL